MKLGIVIVTYNSRNHIARLLDSIIIQKNKDVIIYLVDNNSNDDTLEIAKKYQSELSISIIPSKTNNGYAGGNNIGIQKAISEECDLLFILNPDIQLEEKCLDILTNRIMLDEQIGVIGPLVLFGNNPENIIQFYSAKVNFKTQRKVSPFSNKKLTVEIPSEIYCDFVLGGAMLIRSTVFKVTGLFEEDYFMYNDELDIAYRIQKAGFQTLCIRDAIVRHFHDFNSINIKGNNLMYYYVMRNKYLYFKKFHLYLYLYFTLIIEIIIFPLKIIWSIRRMRNIKILKFYYSGLLEGLLGKKGYADKSFN